MVARNYSSQTHFLFPLHYRIIKLFKLLNNSLDKDIHLHAIVVKCYFC